VHHRHFLNGTVYRGSKTVLIAAAAVGARQGPAHEQMHRYAYNGFILRYLLCGVQLGLSLAGRNMKSIYLYIGDL